MPDRAPVTKLLHPDTQRFGRGAEDLARALLIDGREALVQGSFPSWGRSPSISGRQTSSMRLPNRHSFRFVKKLLFP